MRHRPIRPETTGMFVVPDTHLRSLSFKPVTDSALLDIVQLLLADHLLSELLPDVVTDLMLEVIAPGLEPLP